MAEPPAKRAKRTDSSAMWDSKPSRPRETDNLEPQNDRLSERSRPERSHGRGGAEVSRHGTRDKRNAPRREERDGEYDQNAEKRRRSRSRDRKGGKRERERSGSRDRRDRRHQNESRRDRSRDQDRYRDGDAEERRDRERVRSRDKRRSRKGKFSVHIARPTLPDQRLTLHSLQKKRQHVALNALGRTRGHAQDLPSAKNPLEHAYAHLSGPQGLQTPSRHYLISTPNLSYPMQPHPLALDHRTL